MKRGHRAAPLAAAMACRVEGSDVALIKAKFAQYLVGMRAEQR